MTESPPPARHETLLEINARVWLKEQPWAVERPDLAQIPDAQIQAWADLGIDWIWMMGVWEPSPRSLEVCTAPPAKPLVDYCWEIVPDAMPGAMVGSPYAIRDYKLNPRLGGLDSLARLKDRLNARGVRLMLDFVPNHTAQDHPWILDHPEYYILGTDSEYRKNPHAYFRTTKGDVIAMGKDPLFAPWTDTAQVNYCHPKAIEAMQGLLLAIARQCDGVRCDMAMLVTNDVFQRTWGTLPVAPGTEDFPTEFWEKTIPLVKQAHPGFCFLGEVYWDLEWQLQGMGFDYTYDKRLYDRLVEGNGPGVRDHLALAPTEFQNRLARFVENHDEPRAQEALGARHRAAAVLSAAAPGMWFMHEGQWEGRRIKIPVQLDVRPAEHANEDLAQWYGRLLVALKEEPWRTGSSHVLVVQKCSADDATHRQIIPLYRATGRERGLAVANLGSTEARGFVFFPQGEFSGGGAVRLRDGLSQLEMERSCRDLESQGLYLDLQPGQAHLFRLDR